MNTISNFFHNLHDDTKCLREAPQNNQPVAISTSQGDFADITKAALRNSIAHRIGSLVLLGTTVTCFIGAIPLVGGSMLVASVLLGATAGGVLGSHELYKLGTAPLKAVGRQETDILPSARECLTYMQQVGQETRQDLNTIKNTIQVRDPNFYAAIRRIAGRALVCLLPAYFLSGVSVLHGSILGSAWLVTKLGILALGAKMLLDTPPLPHAPPFPRVDAIYAERR